ncbi:MAG: KamA family radical SAM protein [Clostridiales bacterium]|nr:KamA family radical SAM protein [Clostridiales bacterium]
MNEKVFAYFHTSPDSKEWADWKWQYRNRITDVEALAEILPLSDKDKQEIATSLSHFRMAITPYFLSLVDPEDPCCPLRLQSIPSLAETMVQPWETKDPLNEDEDSPAPYIVHRYPDRALFLVTRQCAMYCRHCVRKRHVGEEDVLINHEERDRVIAYIAAKPEIRDVLISGGDPLTMDDGPLEDIIARLRAIPHVEIIRIGSRVPAVLPMRVTPSLLAMLRKYHPLWMNVHFNHPKELTPAAVKACADIADAGIPLGNQSVLLRGVNDDLDTMKTLLLRLVQARVRPYYIYQCDLFEGSEHFRTKVETGMEIIRGLTGAISGFAIPRFVIDAPNGGGKVPINPDYIVSIDEKRIEMQNYLGKTYVYPQPGL